MLKIFITASFVEGKRNKNYIEKLCSLVKEAGFEDFCFVRDVEGYKQIFTDPHSLMRRARKEIEKSDLLLIDMTDKPTGRAIEAGIAYALNKKIIVIMKKGIKIKETSKGIAYKIIEYNTLSEILETLKELAKTG